MTTMKTIKIITVIILTIFFIDQDAQSQNQETTNTNKSNLTIFNPQDKSGLLHLDNAITIKLKEGVGDFSKQSGTVKFGVLSLDEKISQFEVYSLDKRFRHNPNKLKNGMPDLSRIYRISFPDHYSINQVVKVFSEDPNVEYAEPIPINIVDEIPNDALYSQSQHLPQIWAEQAWNIHKGEDGTEETS